MPNHREDVTSEHGNDSQSEFGDEVETELGDEDASDEDVIDEFAERRDLDDDDSWIEDGEKYRCPECQAVHEERADECRVCGWPDG